MTEGAARDDQPWRFSTADLPPADRNDAWRDAMRRLRLPFVSIAGEAPFDGQVTAVNSPLGLSFALVEAGAQFISGRSETQIEGLWLSILLSGEGTMRSAGFEARFERGHILFGITRKESTLALAGRHVQLFVRIPQRAIAPRLLAPLDAPVAILPCREGAAAVFYRLLEATAEELKVLGPDQLRPIEIAIIEFLVASLAAGGGRRARGGARGARASLLHRIRQHMEAMLDDPELDVDAVAADIGISPRYLRRLFAAEGEHFGAYLKARRLERCHADLVSPLHAQLGVSEIAFRWGFSDAAHFSRSFRDRFGLSPREHRRRGGREAPSSGAA